MLRDGLDGVQATLTGGSILLVVELLGDSIDGPVELLLAMCPRGENEAKLKCEKFLLIAPVGLFSNPTKSSPMIKGCLDAREHNKKKFL